MATRIVGLLLTGAVVLTLLEPHPSRAHHSFSAQYDAEQQITLRGLVTKIEWRNPHAYFYMDVDDGRGNISQWAFEMGAPIVLARRGWARDSLKIGDIVEVNGARARDGSALVNATAVLFPDTGKRLTASDGPIGGTAVPQSGEKP
jgi:DNA/RNA endonuclease YhcR with UshA esterase domain